MAQKWYQKGSIQAAIVGGVCVILAAVITGIFTLSEGPDGRIVISDILINQQEEQKRCLIDFRVTNSGDSEVSISRIRFKVVEVDRIYTLGFMEFSKIYDLDISQLENCGDVAELKVSQVVEPRRNDRFGVVVVANDMAMGEFRQWHLEPSLITSDGIIHGEPVEVWLPRHLHAGDLIYRRFHNGKLIYER